MANTSIFQIDNMDVDLKTYVKLRCKSCLGDSVIFKFLVYNESSPVNLSDYKIEFRARLPKSGQVYSETDNITMNGNELTVTCDNVLTSEIGECIITLRLVDIITYKQKSNYIIILKVMSTIDADEEIQTSSTLSALSSLDYAIDRYFELKVDLLDQITIGNLLLNNLISNIATGSTLNTSLITQNTNASLNISTLITQNNQATNNISTLTTKNNQATNNVSVLTTKNNEAITNTNNLNNSINIGTSLNSSLHTENIIGTKLLVDLNNANSLINKKIDDHINDNNRHLSIGERESWNMYATQINDIAKLIDILMGTTTIVTENGDNIITETGDILIL